MKLLFLSCLTNAIFLVKTQIHSCSSSSSLVENGIDIEMDTLDLTLTNDDSQVILKGKLGQDLPISELDNSLEPCSDQDLCFEWGTVAKLSLNPTDENCADIQWESKILKSFTDCFDIEDDTKWFGGPEEYYQRFPMDPNFPRESVPYLPGDMLQ